MCPVNVPARCRLQLKPSEVIDISMIEQIGSCDTMTNPAVRLVTPAAINRNRRRCKN
jgi:hypothetical protein